MATGLFGKTIENEYPLTEWVRIFKNGDFDSSDPITAIEAGAYDWWNDKSAYTWVKRFGKKIVQLAESKRVNAENSYVFYKQMCPGVGSLYDSIRICDIVSGKVLFCISHLKKGCYGEDFSGWEICSFTDTTTAESRVKSWREVIKLFNV